MNPVNVRKSTHTELDDKSFDKDSTTKTGDHIRI